ncbi:MAG: fibrillarin-like rRNA/tRNA 2'-O-methyltransferase [Thermoplasmata archaeon]
MKEIFADNLYEENGKLFTASKYPRPVYGEDVIKRNNVYYRLFSPLRSKLSSSIKSGLRPEIKKSFHVVYLGASTGTTVSHVSDIVSDGIVFAIEFSPMPFVKLMQLSSVRSNVLPMLLDASKPQTFGIFIDKTDLVYQDIAQPNQIDIFIRNMKFFSAKRGILMFKTYSMRAGLSINDEIKKLKDEFNVQQVKDISRFHKGHYAITVTS